MATTEATLNLQKNCYTIHFREDMIKHNLKSVYEIDNVPSDTQMT